MADVAESAAFTDPATAISHGKRHLLVRDYTMAVTALAQACQLLAEKHGDTADELGEPYLLYGRALLGLAREEAGVLGGGVPGSEEAEEEDDDDEEEGEDEKLSNVDEKDEEEEEDAAAAEGKEQSSTESKAEKTKAEEPEAKPETEEPKKAEVEEAAKPEAEKKEEKTEAVSEKQEQEKTDSKKTEEKAEQKQKEEEKTAPGSSKETNHANGPSCSSEQNGDVKKNGEEEDTEDIGKEDEEDEVNNLQVAWEVLELAKLVLLKRGEPGWKLLADSYRLLGEVAMEGGNFQGALNDLHKCLELLQQIEPREPRAIAEIHYQLALAHSLGNEFDSSIEEFNKATELLEARIKELEEIKEPPKTEDSFYTVEGEIQELKELLPEIREKISDMKDFKQEACKLVIEGIKSKVAGGCSNGAGPSGSDSGSSPKVQKPASDISHLVRKKRKADEAETETTASPCKKPTPEKAV